IGDVEAAPLRIDHRLVAMVTHTAGADRVCRAIDREDILGTGRFPDGGHGLAGVAIDRLLILMIAEIDPGLAMAKGVGLVG
ncbi:hypothetical protein LTR94_036865, partial [Friedmanniomyces endolithicus]